MSENHKSLRDEILFVLGRASAPLDTGEIYQRCKMAEEIKSAIDAVWQLRKSGKIELIDAPGRKTYRLADGVKAPAPAGQAGRPPKVAEMEPVSGGININHTADTALAKPSRASAVGVDQYIPRNKLTGEGGVKTLSQQPILLKAEPIRIPGAPRFLVDDAGALEIEDDDTTLRMEARDVKRLLKFLTAVKELA